MLEESYQERQVHDKHEEVNAVSQVAYEVK